MRPDKSKFIGEGDQPLTQSLFLELGYNLDSALYTLKEYDHTHKGKKYPSIKQLYLTMEDPTEYEFANQYFYSWKHWKRIAKNKLLVPYVEDWREELEVRLRSQAVRDIVNITADNSQGSFQAAKWLADKGWDKRGAGRPSKAEKKREEGMQDRIAAEFDRDVARLQDYRS